MNKKLTLLTLMSLSVSFNTQAGWFDDWFGNTDQTNTTPAAEVQQEQPVETAAPALNAMAMIPLLTDSLGVTNQQAEGGLGSLFQFAEGNLSSGQFGQLTQALPGVDQLLQAVPQVDAGNSSNSGLSGLLNTAAQYSDSLAAVNQVNQQFQALGLEPQMILQYVQVAQQYLNTPEGQQVKQLLMEGLGGLGATE